MPVPRRPLVPLALAALAGVALGPLLPREVALLAAWGALPAALLALRGRTPGNLRLAVAGVLLACGGLYAARAGTAQEASRSLLERPAPTPGPRELVGTVEGPVLPGGSRRGARWRLLRDDGGRVEVEAPRAGHEPLIGARVRALGGYVPFRDLRGRVRAARAGAHARFRAVSVESLAPGRGLAALLGAAERGARRQILRAATPERAPFLCTVLLGDRAPLAPHLAQAFRDTGAVHLLSISGLHVGLVAGLALALASLAPLSGRERRAGAILGVALYAALAGACVPVLRAALAGLLVCAAPRRGDAWNRLALGLLGVLAWDPLSLWDVDLQLSFGVTAALLLLARPLERLARRPGAAPRLRLLAARVALPFLASVPLVWACLGQLSPASLLANALAVPLCTLVLGLGLAGLAAGPLLPPLGLLLLRGADLSTGALFALLTRLAALPGARVDLLRPAPWLLLLAAGALAIGALRREAGRPARLPLGLGCLLALAALLPSPPGASSGGVRLLVRAGGDAALLAAGGPTAVTLGPPPRDAWRDQALRRLGCLALAPADGEVAPGVMCEPYGRAFLIRCATAGGSEAALLVAPAGIGSAEAGRLLRRLRPRRALLPSTPTPAPPGWEALDPGQDSLLLLPP